MYGLQNALENRRVKCVKVSLASYGHIKVFKLKNCAVPEVKKNLNPLVKIKIISEHVEITLGLCFFGHSVNPLLIF